MPKGLKQALRIMHIVLSAPSYSDGHRCKEVAGDIKIMAIRLSAKAQPCYPFLLFRTQEKSANNTLLSLQQLVGIYSCFFHVNIYVNNSFHSVL